MNPPDDIEAQRALAESMFPNEWAASLALAGEKRRRRQKGLRDQAMAETTMAPLRARGECCGTCGSFDRVAGIGTVCLADSDFHGYALTKADGLCPDWHARPGAVR